MAVDGAENGVRHVRLQRAPWNVWRDFADLVEKDQLRHEVRPAETSIIDISMCRALSLSQTMTFSNYLLLSLQESRIIPAANLMKSCIVDFMLASMEE